MSDIQIDMFEAGNGDCFLLSFNGEKTTNILIDFGYSNTYKKHLRKYLIEKKTKNEVLDLVVISHIDQDHISGGLSFFEENGFVDNPQIIKVNEVWHNSYRHLEMGETKKRLSEDEKEHIINHSIFIEKNREGGISDASGKQGSRLAANLLHFNYNWNSQFGGKSISNDSDIQVKLNDEVKITIITPGLNELGKLKEVWRKELQYKFPTIEMNDEAIFDDAVECISLMRKPVQIEKKARDTSYNPEIKSWSDIEFDEDLDEINASSITFILEFRNKKLLFLGDSPPSIIEKRLRGLYDESEFPIYFNAIKVSHHGSRKNTSKELLELIDSDNYLISTNGKIHDHPHIEAIARIINRSNKNYKRSIYLTNKIPKLNFLNDSALQLEFGYSLKCKNESDDSIQLFL